MGGTEAQQEDDVQHVCQKLQQKGYRLAIPEGVEGFGDETGEGVSRQQEVAQEGVQEQIDVEDIYEGRAEGAAGSFKGDE